MKRFTLIPLMVIGCLTPAIGSEAGAIFLLISPGARAGGMGEANVAVADDAYASYWNPAGLGFLEGSELAMMHVNWLPNLADDLYYDFFAFRRHVPNLGTFGGHLIYLSLGEQIRMGEGPEDYLGTFTSFMMATTVSYSSLLTQYSSFGINAKISYQHLVDLGAGAEKGKGTSLDFGFDLGYLRKEIFTPRLDFGLAITNIGPKVSFIDPAQADPQPTNLALGLKYKVIDDEFNKLSIVYDVNKLLVASYPDMDWDGDGIIGGCDDEGHCSGTPGNGEYNQDGDKETAHTDPVYIAIFTSWIDDWLLGGDTDFSGDGKIGGYDSEGMPTDTISFGQPGYGQYGCEESENICSEENLVKEVGTGESRGIKDELNKLVHNFGMEYWYSEYFALRAGYYLDQSGKISNPTFGVGLRFSGYGFDFGYTSGEPGHPLTNTMRFSLNWEF
ncbi:MAG: PorV/PorQ family protein [Candidatus Marinimicrobia bacterium]|jgi:hypothetical protein|nr:PorV/PorQ family protein [Candidatus Neomarinimicrobiota bacterium]HJM47365.1 PorV/PorQ family protein [Candidatus Neomarinimicrobiota bacterium]